ncbi:DMT family transporter [Bosea sp. TND4EK4]|uniref:DMT family transporter n=1 Tax=Bosea sp. TND4EK4 TaxID=1907408 RepID=UPI00097124E0|nr:DMT family transporter [Bosea sp. TND4EK4]
MPNAPLPEPPVIPSQPGGPLRIDNSARGIALVLLASIFMCSGDIASKYLATSLPALQITWMRYGTFAAIMLATVCFTGGFHRMKTRRPGLQVVRALGVTVSSILFVAALRDLPMADATATSFVSPLFVTALSIPILGEVVGWRRWLATIVGLVGVLVVVRPGGDGFHGASLFVLGSSFFWALSLITTRMMSRTEIPVVTLAYSATIGFVLLSLAVPFSWQALDLKAVLVGAFVGGISTIGHIFLIQAFRYADASLLAPFAYSQLLWASIFGYLVFAAMPDIWTYVGAAIIAGSGLYTAHRERLRARRVATGSQARR